MERKDNAVEKAIAYFENTIKESDEIMKESTPELQRLLTEQRGHFVTALEALRCVADKEG